MLSKSFSFSSSLQKIADCLIFSTGRDGAIFTSTGSWSNAWASLRIFGGIVAENSNVWRS
jgi:hypothetical protein